MSNRAIKYAVRTTENKGYGMFATEKILAGTLVIEEQFLFKLCQHYTSVKQKMADIDKSLSSLTPEMQNTFYQLSDCHRPEKPTALTIYQTNALPLGPGSLSNAIFPTIARINHSCMPNSHHHWNPREAKETVYAVRDIEKNEEILISYIDTYMDRASRETKLKEYFNFLCNCQLCSVSDPVAIKKSDVRRRVLKNLETEFLTSEGRPSDNLDEKVKLFIKISKEENVYTRSCDIGGPCFTAFQFLYSKTNGNGDSDEELLSYWAELTVDHNLACKGHFEVEGVPVDTIVKYADKKKEDTVK